MTVRLATVAAGAVFAFGGLAWAQTPPGSGTPLQGKVNERGVRVLKAEEPTGSASAAPTPTPPVVTPTPAKVTTATGEGGKPAPTPVVAPMIKLCARPFKTTDVHWDGASKIDSALAQKLKTRQRVVVDLAQPYPETAEAPAALSPWLSEVQKGGGSVTVKQYCKAARGNLGTWLAKLFGGGGGGGGALYRPARQYDVLLHSDALDKLVTQVEFVPKAAAS